MRTQFKVLVLAGAVALAAGTPLRAEEAKPAEAAPAAAGSPAPAAQPASPAAAGPAPAQVPAVDAAKSQGEKKEVVLTPEEKAEKEARKACKVDICAAFRNPKAAGSDITCDVMKSFRKEQLIKMVARLKITWPYGPVKCTSAVKLKRDDLLKAVTEPKHQSQLEKHAVQCVIERDNEAASEIKFEFTPKVEFADGKAVSAKMNWGKIEAPTLVKGAMWTATAADNTVNMLSSWLVEDINDFVFKKCDEVKDDWSARK